MTREVTLWKVKNFLNNLKDPETEDITNLSKFAHAWSLSQNYSPILREMEVVRKDPKTKSYYWAHSSTPEELAPVVAELVREYTMAES